MLDDVGDPSGRPIDRGDLGVAPSLRESGKPSRRRPRLATRHDQAETDRRFVAAAADLIGKVQRDRPRRSAVPTLYVAGRPGRERSGRSVKAALCEVGVWVSVAAGR